jgi:hypothetical protein
MLHQKYLLMGAGLNSDSCQFLMDRQLAFAVSEFRSLTNNLADIWLLNQQQLKLYSFLVIKFYKLLINLHNYLVIISYGYLLVNVLAKNSHVS